MRKEKMTKKEMNMAMLAEVLRHMLALDKHVVAKRNNPVMKEKAGDVTSNYGHEWVSHNPFSSERHIRLVVRER